MARIKARKVHTPGSQPSTPVVRSRGRPRKHVKARKERRINKKHDSDTLARAVEAIKTGMSIRSASELYEIPKSTLADKVKGFHNKEVGRPVAISAEEEKLLVERILLASEWGFPMSTKDLKSLVKNYLDSLGVVNSRFKENYPGKDWIKAFLNRHSDLLSVRTANLLKRSRGAVSREQIDEFFQHFSVATEGIPPENMFNYDETNLRDDPGVKKAIFKKGVKYAEYVRDHSLKSCISVMFCGSAAGVLLPPYVVYKAQNVYQSWCAGGPDGTVYSCTKSGWFDMFIFEDWFMKIFLPHVRRLPGRKLLLGDNLASHLSVNVINSCRENNIAFVCFPPNTTDKLQPLDVGLFAPMKQEWKKQLSKYKDQDPSAKLLAKTEFPRMLKELCNNLNFRDHLPKAFEKCGLYPLNAEKPKERIPSVASTETIARHIDQQILKSFEVKRFGGAKKPRGKKVPAGQSYTNQPVETSESDQSSNGEGGGDESASDDVQNDTTDEDELPDEVPVERLPSARNNNVKKTLFTPVTVAGRKNKAVNGKKMILNFIDQETPSSSQSRASTLTSKWKCGDLVCAVYEGEWFLAEVKESQGSQDHVLLSYMKIKGHNTFAWDKEDLYETPVSD